MQHMHRFELGDLTCTQVPDGYFPYPRELLQPGASQDGTIELPEEVPLPYQALLVEGQGGRLLVDTGAGPLGPDSGRLGANLQAAGIDPARIDTVLLTHAHADHIGGLLNASGELAFPNARILLARTEWEFWLGLSTSGRLGAGGIYGNPAIEQLILDGLQKYLFPLADRVELIDRDTEIISGAQAFALPGHTPGHLGVAIAAGGQSLLYLADGFFFPEQVERPNWMVAFDTEPDAVRQSRQAASARAASEGSLVAICHSGRVGRIEKAATGFQWVDAGEPVGVRVPEHRQDHESS